MYCCARLPTRQYRSSCATTRSLRGAQGLGRGICSRCRLGLGLSVLGGSGSLLEAVLEAAGEGLHVPHAAGALSAAALRLLGPVEATHLGGRVAARGADLLLLVEGGATAPPAGRVGLVMPLSERRSSLRHGAGE
eukprot:TRINITY_DN5366_c0_g1_i1.p1 TRINITY_DN5366_c0_g1~~TRINITY_DN5366_c0_g1_i1.p1  ORF type:complete len:135 (+),score=10.98 TRINITY_DN5366_c0_g1_i1:407-811(+)